MVARVCVSPLTCTPSLASTAWCSPSDQRRPCMVRPVNSSTMRTCPSCHQVVHVALVQRVRLQQLVDDVELLALDGVFRLDLPPCLDPLLGGQRRVVFRVVDGLRDVGDDEELGVVRGHRLRAPLGQVHRVALLVEHEIQVVLDVAHLLLPERQLPVGERVEFRALQQRLHAGLVQHLQQLLVLRHRPGGPGRAGCPRRPASPRPGAAPPPRSAAG